MLATANGRLYTVDLGGPTDIVCSAFKTIDAGHQYSCGVLSDNTVICWGGDNEFGERDAPSGSFKSLSVGRHHSCGLRTDNTVTCWGYRVPGSNSAPAGTFKSVSVGNHSCGLRTDNTITCWGDSGITVDGKFYGQGEPPSGTFKSVTVGTLPFLWIANRQYNHLLGSRAPVGLGP